jgi:hypothetical protein
MDDILERADTPEERAEDAIGWNQSEVEADDHFPPEREALTDEEVDLMWAEENATVRRAFIERAQAHLRWIERSGIEQVQ